MNSRIRWTALLAWVLAALLAGCSSAPPTQQAGSPSPDNAGRPATGAASAKATTPTRRDVTVAVGTTLSVRLVNGIDTGTAGEGSSFEATLASPLVVDGVEAAAVGSSISGRVTHVVSSGRLNRPAELSLTLTSLTPKGGRDVTISTNTWSEKGESHKKRNIEMIGGGAAGGTLIGALAGGKKGAGIGALIGGGGGTAVAAATGKKEIQLPSETRLSFTLREAVSLPVMKP